MKDRPFHSLSLFLAGAFLAYSALSTFSFLAYATQVGACVFIYFLGYLTCKEKQS